MKKRGLVVLAFILIIFLIFLSVKFINTKNAYTAPYKIVAKVIQDANQDTKESKYIVNNNDWQSVSQTSVFNELRAPLNWGEFKKFIQQCEGPTYSLSFEDGNAEYKVMSQFYNVKHRIIGVTCFEYNKENGDHIGSKSINLLLEDIEGSWRVVGKEQESN